MDATADRSWRPGLLASIEAEFFALRRRPPNLLAAFRNAIAHAAGPSAAMEGAAISQAGEFLVVAVDRPSAARELAYHNRHHVVEVVLAMGWLCGAARRMGMVSAEDAALGVTAMVGHDLLHDGSPPGGGALERRSADAAAGATAALPLTDRQRAVLRAVILGTNPDHVAENQARAAGDLPPGPFGRGVDLVIATANEADVFASLLPNLGWHLTHRLARERAQSGYIWAADIADPESRIAFLTTYARLTPAARQLGLDALRGWQVAASEQVVAATRCGCAADGAWPERGAGRQFVAARRRVAPPGE